MPEQCSTGGRTSSSDYTLTMGRTTLRLAGGEIHWDPGFKSGCVSHPLTAVTRVGWGVTRLTTTTTVVVVPVWQSTSVTYHIRFGDDRRLTEVSQAIVDTPAARDAFKGFTDRLWSGVGLRLVNELLQGLRAGRTYAFGPDLSVADDGVEIRKRGFFGAGQPVRVPWSKVKVWISNGRFCVGSADDEKTHVALPYTEANNAHVLEAAIRAWFKEGGRRLGDLAFADQRAPLVVRMKELNEMLETEMPQLLALKSRLDELAAQAAGGAAVDRDEYARLTAEHRTLLERCRADNQTLEELLAEYKRLGGV